MTQLIKQYSPIYVFATLGIAFFGSYACITLYEQYRLVSKDNRPKLVNPNILMLLMSFSLGGVAIWSMHFIAMSGAVFINADTREEVPVRYRVDLSIVSLVAVVIFSLLGLVIASHDRNFVMDEKDIASSYVRHVRMLSISQIRKIKTKRSLLISSLFRNMAPLLIGGTLTATGVCVMHYVGMMAMVFDGRIHWNYGIIAASVLIALIAATAALWILFRLLAIFPEMELLRFGSAVIAACAVNGMHYTGMTAGIFHYEPDRRLRYDGPTLSQTSAVIYSAIVAATFLWVIFLVVIADLREWYQQLFYIVRETDKLMKYHKAANLPKDSLLNDYMALRSTGYKSDIHNVNQSNHDGKADNTDGVSGHPAVPDSRRPSFNNKASHANHDNVNELNLVLHAIEKYDNSNILESTSLSADKSKSIAKSGQVYGTIRFQNNIVVSDMNIESTIDNFKNDENIT